MRVVARLARHEKRDILRFLFVLFLAVVSVSVLRAFVCVRQREHVWVFVRVCVRAHKRLGLCAPVCGGGEGDRASACFCDTPLKSL